MKKTLLSLGLVGVLASGAVAAQEKTSKFYAGVGFGIMTIEDGDGSKFSDANNAAIQLGYKISENFAIEGHYSKSTKDASTQLTVEDVDITEAWQEMIRSYNPGLSMGEIRDLYPFAEASVDINVDAGIETTAIYGVYRSSGNVYFKAKAGYLREKATFAASINALDFYVVSSFAAPMEFTLTKDDEGFKDFDNQELGSMSESDSGFSGGLGLGYNLNHRFFAEVEYTLVEDDVDFYSLSINYTF